MAPEQQMMAPDAGQQMVAPEQQMAFEQQMFEQQMFEQQWNAPGEQGGPLPEQPDEEPVEA
eukprot:2963678-Alexandrium_andersonii.AAC.1